MRTRGKGRRVGRWILVLTLAIACSREEPLPAGWEVGGWKLDRYRIGVDPGGGRNGGSAIRLAARGRDTEGSAAAMRWIDPEPYRGQRWRLEAWVRSAGDGVAGLFLRADGAELQGLAFDNMMRRRIRGETAWQRYEIVFEVPPETARMHYGLWLAGDGRVWAEDFVLEPAPPEADLTAGPLLLSTSLDFDDFGPR